MALDYPFLNLSDILTSSCAGDTTSISSSNIVSSSMFVADGLDACVPPPLPPHLRSNWPTASSTTAFPSVAPSSVYTSTPPHLQLSTPENSPQTTFHHSYLPLAGAVACDPCSLPPPPPLPATSTQLHVPLVPSISPGRDHFFNGSSLEESPISSPGDLEREKSTLGTSTSYAPLGAAEKLHGFNATCPSPFSQYGLTAAATCAGFDSPTSSGENESIASRHHHHHHHLTKNVPDGVKMPQRKGGMQLWQFLYSMLNDKDGKYRNLIEWTNTAKERQFRLLEPDAIAVWWGHHKNKPNMSYDKLSRSLRYYYDKGIIRKINGERFVYRFCIDPEVMYKHMGTSNARPQLKPMPKDAKVALNTTKDRSVTGASPCIAKEPETLQMGSGASVEQIPTSYQPLFPTAAATYSTTLSLPPSSSSSFIVPNVGPEMRRCRSYDSSCRSSTLSPIVSSPSPTSFDGYPSLYDSLPQHFSSTQSPDTTSPTQGTSLDDYPCVPLNDPHHNFDISSFPLPLPLPLAVGHHGEPYTAAF